MLISAAALDSPKPSHLRLLAVLQARFGIGQAITSWDAFRQTHMWVGRTKQPIHRETYAPSLSRSFCEGSPSISRSLRPPWARIWTLAVVGDSTSQEVKTMDAQASRFFFMQCYWALP